MLPCPWARVFGLASSHTSASSDSTRNAAGAVTGVGFLGAGVILREQGRITGLTTAATIWATASVGLGFAFGMYVLGALTALIVFALLAVHHLSSWQKLKTNHELGSTSKEASEGHEEVK